MARTVPQPRTRVRLSGSLNARQRLTPLNDQWIMDNYQ